MLKCANCTSSSMSFPISLTGNEIVDASSSLYMLCIPSKRTWTSRRRTGEQNCGTIRLSQDFIQTTAFKGENVVLRTDLGSIPVAGLCCSYHRGSATLLIWALESTLELSMLGKKGRWGELMWYWENYHKLLSQIDLVQTVTQIQDNNNYICYHVLNTLNVPG